MWKITPFERAALQLMADGKPTSEIAGRLGRNSFVPSAISSTEGAFKIDCCVALAEAVSAAIFATAPRADFVACRATRAQQYRIDRTAGTA